MKLAVNIFDFDDYRSFLKSWLESAKESKSSNLTRLAESMSIHPTYLSHVLSGSKNLSPEQAFLVSEYLSLTALEKELFFTLIQIERAGSVSLKKYLIDKKLELMKEKDQLKKRFDSHRELTDSERATYYSSWIYSAIAVATDIQNGQTAEELCEKFSVGRSQIQQILDFLTSIGLVVEKKGIFSLGETHVHVPNESGFVVKHHTNWRLKAIQGMDFRNNKELFFTVPMSISEKDFDKIREKITAAIQDIVSVAKKSNSEHVVCLNIDFFKITKK